MRMHTLLPLLLAAGPAVPQQPPPLACQAHALSAAERERQQELLKVVRGAATAVDELENGYALRLPADPELFRQLAEWVGLERRCCGFVGFAIEWDEHDRVTLRVTGGPGVKAVLEAEIAGGLDPGASR